MRPSETRSQPTRSRQRAGWLSAGIPGSDIAALIGYVLLAAALAYLSVEPPLATPSWSMALLTAGGIVCLVIRSRSLEWSCALALALMLLSAAGGTGAEVALVIMVLYRAGATRSARTAWLGFALAAATGTVSALVLALRLRFGPPLLGLSPRAVIEAWPVDWASMSIAFVAAALIATSIGINIGHQRRHVGSLVARAEQMKRERDQQASIASARERERISREMHDVIAHSLAVMIALADGAGAAASRRPEEARVAIARVAETGRRTLSEVRRLLEHVRDDSDDPSAQRSASPGPAQLPALVEEFRAAGLPVRLERTGEFSADTLLGFAVYRIVQESLTNVLRHGRDVRDVLVRLLVSAQEVTILVEDRSAPARTDASAQPGRGLVGIRERAAFYDGEVDAGPRPGGGWRVQVRLVLGER